jgi:glycosyltransferase involved in cell wall biosynthesis
VRIAIVGDFPHDPARIQGGVEAVVAYLARSLAAFPDLDVHTLTLKPGLAQARTAEWNRVTAHYVPAAFRFANLTLHRENRRRLRAALTRIAPDVVHAHIAGVYGLTAAGFGCPWLLTIHGIRHREFALRPGLGNRFRQLLVGWMERTSIAAARHLIAISPYVVDEFGPIIRGQVHHLENPIDEKFFALRNREQANTVLFAGRIIPRKGALELIQAIERIRRHVPGVQLRMAGGPLESQAPGYMAMVEDYVRAHGLIDHVIFLGQLGEADLLNEYETCALMALPSKQETAPMAIEELMAAGKPIVSTRVGGIPYLVDRGRTGLTVEPGDVEGLASAITRLLLDGDLRRRMGRAARSEAERRFRVGHIATRTRDIYYQAISQLAPSGKPAQAMV